MLQYLSFYFLIGYLSINQYIVVCKSPIIYILFFGYYCFRHQNWLEQQNFHIALGLGAIY